MKKILFSIFGLLGVSLMLASCDIKDITKNNADTTPVTVDEKKTKIEPAPIVSITTQNNEKDFSMLFEMLQALANGDSEEAEKKTSAKSATELLKELEEYNEFLHSSSKKETPSLNYDNFNNAKQVYESMSQALNEGLTKIESSIGTRPESESYLKTKEYVDQQGAEVKEKTEQFWEKFGPIYDWILQKMDEESKKIKEENQGEGNNG